MSKKTVKGLGKGLEEIFGLGLEKAIDSIEENKKERLDIEINEIHLNPYQPRKTFDEEKLAELSESIKNHGVFQPILVRKTVDGYELIAGERRLRASQMAGLRLIPAVVVDIDDKSVMEIAILENIQRENLSVIEEARAYERLMGSHQYTQEMLANRLGKSRSYVANILRLLRLPQSTQNYVMERKLTMGHVRALLPLEDMKMIEEISLKIMNENLSVRAVEDLVKKLLKPKVEKPISTDHKLLALQTTLQDKLQTTVKLSDKQIVIKYVNKDDLNRLLEIMHLLED